MSKAFISVFVLFFCLNLSQAAVLAPRKDAGAPGISTPVKNHGGETSGLETAFENISEDLTSLNKKIFTQPEYIDGPATETRLSFGVSVLPGAQAGGDMHQASLQLYLEFRNLRL